MNPINLFVIFNKYSRELKAFEGDQILRQCIFQLFKLKLSFRGKFSLQFSIKVWR